jgi:hypothetical protein
MKLASLIFTASISLAYSSQQAKAPEDIAFKREAKMYYDRIVQEEPVRMQKCRTFGTVWYRGACWRPERILANAR